VFQLESAGMRKALVGMKPDRFEDIIALVALYRPGPMENIPTYNCAQAREEEIDYIHPKIERILKETFGVIVYQEQVMQIAQVCRAIRSAKPTCCAAPWARRSAPRWTQAARALRRGAVERGVDQGQADEIFDLLAKFADYGFNKSHAAAYALVSYQTAYLKAHYPVEFLAASMTLDMSNTDKLAEFRLLPLCASTRRLQKDIGAPSRADVGTIRSCGKKRGIGRRSPSWYRHIKAGA
jgi:DNA polymerase-3 subunit alpha